VTIHPAKGTNLCQAQQGQNWLLQGSWVNAVERKGLHRRGGWCLSCFLCQGPGRELETEGDPPYPTQTLGRGWSLSACACCLLSLCPQPWPCPSPNFPTLPFIYEVTSGSLNLSWLVYPWEEKWPTCSFAQFPLVCGTRPSPGSPVGVPLPLPPLTWALPGAQLSPSCKPASRVAWALRSSPDSVLQADKRSPKQ
jgi:hypothetical protein